MSKTAIGEAKKGSTEILILALVEDESRHGYEIAKQIEARSQGTLTFTLDAGAGANGLQGMLPLQTAAGSLTSLTRGGSNVTFTTATLKGVQYALFTGTAGSYSAHYGP